MSFDLLPEYKHHSASTVSKFITNRAEWFRKVYEKVKFEQNIHTARGQAVEAGINHWLEQEEPNIPEAISKAHEVFTKQAAGLSFEPMFKNVISTCVQEGIAYLTKEYDYKRIQQQRKFELRLPDLEKHIIGYEDWFIDKDVVIDCKCSGTKPSKLKQDYVIQGSVYKLAEKIRVDFVFIVPNSKGEVSIVRHTLSKEEFDFGTRLFMKAAQAIETIVNEPFDLDLLKTLCFPDPSSLFNDRDTKLILDAWNI